LLRVGIKRVEGGAFSTWANEELTPGTVLEAMPPMGAFHTPIDPAARKSYLGFAGGSGITPLLSIIKTTLAREPKSRFTLVYANRQINTIMFREELEDLKNTYLGRFSLLHVLEAETQEIDLFTGRVDAQKCAALFRTWIDLPAIDTAFICGPEPMMLGIAAALREHGMSDAQIKFELFASGQPGRAKARPVSAKAADGDNSTDVTLTLDGATRRFRMPKAGQSLLDAALENTLDAPYACKAGVCSTCRAKVLEGEVEMLTNHALEDYEVRAGYVLSCQCYPLTDTLVVSYDQ
jgi:ring-1,2-phenylacetyl-CoA epoxidase subunit PaaE